MGERFQRRLADHMPLLVFVASYLVLVVLGNLLLAVYGKDVIPGYNIDFLYFPETFTIGFWTLLLSPLVAVPALYFVARSAMRRFVERSVSWCPSISAGGFTVVLIALLAIVALSLVATDSLKLLSQARDPLASIEARFQIRGRLGFFSIMVLQALLTYWSFVAVIKSVRERRAVWIVLAAISIVGTTIGLVALNMKWPVLLFYAGISIALFSYSRRWAFLTAAVSAVVLVFAYVAISAFVFRIAPNEMVATEQAASPAAADAPIAVPEPKLDPLGSYLRYGPLAIRNLIFRLASVFPYYYHEVEQNGVMCGGLLAQAKVGACRPARVIYDKMYTGDQFQGRGTSNISVHVSAFALGGWPLAISSLGATALVLAFFSCIPIEFGSAAGALKVAGALAAYHLSQIPGEGFLIYEHGLMWVVMLLIVYKLASSVRRA